MKNKFTEEDKNKFVEFLNFIAKRAEFNKMSAEDIINFFKLFSHMQQKILVKIDANILEILGTRQVDTPPIPSKE